MNKLNEIRQTQEQLKELIASYEGKTESMNAKADALVELHYGEICEYVLNAYTPYKDFYKKGYVFCIHSSYFRMPKDDSIKGEYRKIADATGIDVCVSLDDNKVVFLDCVGGVSYYGVDHSTVVNNWQNIKKHLIPCFENQKEKFLDLEKCEREKAKKRLDALKDFVL